MTLEVSQHLQQRLAAVVHDLKDSIGQEAARAYLTRITTTKSLEFEPGTELCDDSSMKYNEDCMTDTSDPSYPTPFLSYEKIEEPCLQMMNLQIEADPCYPASSPQIANPVSPEREHPRRFTNHVENQRNIARGQGPHKNNNANHSATESVDDVGNAWIIQQTKYTFSAFYIFALFALILIYRERDQAKNFSAQLRLTISQPIPKTLLLGQILSRKGTACYGLSPRYMLPSNIAKISRLSVQVV